MSSPTERRDNTPDIADTVSQQTLRAERAVARARRANPMGILALAGALGLGGLFVWQAGVLAPPAPQEVKTPDTVAKPEQVTSTTSSIAGRDRNNRPYEIHAASGEQDKQVETLVHMTTVTGVFERPSGAKLDVRSERGQFDRKGHDLLLTGNVVFSEGTRFTATMQEASINIDDQSLTSRTAVTVDMQGTMIEADSLTVTGEGSRILFKGGVKARFANSNKKTGDGG
jgi:lipopolysaccharide export system protein LptC